MIDSTENNSSATVCYIGFNNGSSYLEKENHRIPDGMGTGGEVCVNFIDPPRSKRHTSGTHDVASDFAERPLVKPVSTSLRGDILRCGYIYRGERAQLHFRQDTVKRK